MSKIRMSEKEALQLLGAGNALEAAEKKVKALEKEVREAWDQAAKVQMQLNQIRAKADELYRFIGVSNDYEGAERVADELRILLDRTDSEWDYEWRKQH